MIEEILWRNMEIEKMIQYYRNKIEIQMLVQIDKKETEKIIKEFTSNRLKFIKLHPLFREVAENQSLRSELLNEIEKQIQTEIGLLNVQPNPDFSQVMESQIGPNFITEYDKEDLFMHSLTRLKPLETEEVKKENKIVPKEAEPVKKEETQEETTQDFLFGVPEKKEPLVIKSEEKVEDTKETQTAHKKEVKNQEIPIEEVKAKKQTPAAKASIKEDKKIESTINPETPKEEKKQEITITKPKDKSNSKKNDIPKVEKEKTLVNTKEKIKKEEESKKLSEDELFIEKTKDMDPEQLMSEIQKKFSENLEERIRQLDQSREKIKLAKSMQKRLQNDQGWEPIKDMPEKTENDKFDEMYSN